MLTKKNVELLDYLDADRLRRLRLVGKQYVRARDGASMPGTRIARQMVDRLRDAELLEQIGDGIRLSPDCQNMASAVRNKRLIFPLRPDALWLLWVLRNGGRLAREHHRWVLRRPKKKWQWMKAAWMNSRAVAVVLDAFRGELRVTRVGPHVEWSWSR